MRAKLRGHIQQADLDNLEKVRNKFFLPAKQLSEQKQKISSLVAYRDQIKEVLGQNQQQKVAKNDR